MKAFEMLLLPLTLTVSLTTGRVARAAPQQPGRHVASLGVYEPPADQDVAAAHLRAGIELANREKLSEAAEQFVEALQVNPEFAEAHYNLGLIRLKWGDLDGAVRSFREALRINPLYTLAQLRLANALTQLARDDQRYVDEAIAAYRRVLTLDPKQPEAHFNSGFLAAKRLDFRTAAAEYEKTLSLDPKYPGARLNLGISVYKLGDFQRAYSLCRTAVAEEPGSAEAHQYLGLALSKHSEWEAAVQELRTAARLDPENQQTHYAFAEALRKTGRSGEATAEFRLVQHIQEGWHRKVQADFREYEARKMIEAGQVDSAIDNYRQLLQLRKDARTATNLGSALLWKGDADEAIRVLREALQINPSYAWAYYYLGVSLARKHEYDRGHAGLGEHEGGFDVGVPLHGGREARGDHVRRADVALGIFGETTHRPPKIGLVILSHESRRRAGIVGEDQAAHPEPEVTVLSETASREPGDDPRCLVPHDPADRVGIPDERAVDSVHGVEGEYPGEEREFLQLALAPGKSQAGRGQHDCHEKGHFPHGRPFFPLGRRHGC